MSTYVIGDIHGELEQLKCLIAKMNLKDEDKLYILGDVVDRGPNPIKALQYLMTIPNCVCLAGNHEVMMLSNTKLLLRKVDATLLKTLPSEDIERLIHWLNNGAASTISEMTELSSEERNKVIEYVGDFDIYVELEVEGKKYFLVHGGINNFSPDKELDDYEIDDFVWARPDYSESYYEDVIVVTGHTPTFLIPENPNPGYIFKGNNHIAVDCGAFAQKGRLAGICLETGEEFYSR